MARRYQETRTWMPRLSARNSLAAPRDTRSATSLTSVEQGEAGGEAVEEVPAADRSDLARAERAGRRDRAEHLLDEPGVVIGNSEQMPAPPVAREHEGGPGLGPTEQLTEVL